MALRREPEIAGVSTLTSSTSTFFSSEVKLGLKDKLKEHIKMIYEDIQDMPLLPSNYFNANHEISNLHSIKKLQTDINALLINKKEQQAAEQSCYELMDIVCCVGNLALFILSKGRSPNMQNPISQASQSSALFIHKLTLLKRKVDGLIVNFGHYFDDNEHGMVATPLSPAGRR